MEFPIFIDHLFIVIVLYRKKFEEIPFFQAFNKDTLPSLSIFLYDNSPEPQYVADRRVIYKHDPHNSGISKAYNEGARIASLHNKKWILFLDQDTALDTSFFHQLAEVIVNNPRSVAFVPALNDQKGIVSPFRWSFGRGRRIQSIASVLPLNMFRFANSGLLVARDAFEKAGGYMETIPLDFSDIAFGEKLQGVTDHFVVVNKSLAHSFSGSTKVTQKEAGSRFHYFCLGAFGMGKTFGPSWLYFGRALLRALHLSIRHKSLNFIKIFIRHAARS